MKLNMNKVGTLYSCQIEGIGEIKYGWYESGKAFIAHDDELYSYTEACRLFFPTDRTVGHNYFISDGYVYDKTINGIVRCLIKQYNSK